MNVYHSQRDLTLFNYTMLYPNMSSIFTTDKVSHIPAFLFSAYATGLSYAVIPKLLRFNSHNAYLTLCIQYRPRNTPLYFFN